MMLVLDTTILIDASMRKAQLSERSQNWKSREKRYALPRSTHWNYIEVHIYPAKSSEIRRKTKELLDDFVVLDINNDTYDLISDDVPPTSTIPHAVGRI